jgi:predicted RNase H-like HicB family nuclease
MKTTALIERGKDGTFGIFTPDIDHTIIGDGKTVTEAKADFENSVKEMILSYTERGAEVPEELKNIEFEYKYDVASIFDYYDWINVSRFAKTAGINASLLSQYKNGLAAYISEKQVRKIETALHRAGSELQAAQLI